MTKTLPKGHTSILSSTFVYVPAVRTDVAKTFARIRQERVARGERVVYDSERNKVIALKAKT